MSTTDNTTTDAEVKNPAALMTKNRELLDTIAKLKGELQAAQHALQEQTQRTDGLAAELHDMRVIRPWRAALADVVGEQTAPALERCLDGLVNVVAGEDGGPTLQTKDGAALEHDGKPVRATSDDLYQWIHRLAESGGEDLRPLLPRATGAGATGNPGKNHGPMPRARENNPAPQKRPAYGLR